MCTTVIINKTVFENMFRWPYFTFNFTEPCYLKKNKLKYFNLVKELTRAPIDGYITENRLADYFLSHHPQLQATI